MECEFCAEPTELVALPDLMRHSLFLKYSQSQNYHYTKGINEIMAGQRTPTTILFKDLQHFDHAEETLNKCYSPSAWDKLKMLGEYYKFHNDIPRMFMLPAVVSLNYYHDKKRRLEYFRIARMIEEENRKNPDKPPKGIVGDSPVVLESEQVTAQEASSSDEVMDKNDRILDGISVTEKSNASQHYFNHQPPYQFTNFKAKLQKFQHEIKTNPNIHFESYMNQSHGQHLVDQIREQIQIMVQQRKNIMKSEKPVTQPPLTKRLFAKEPHNQPLQIQQPDSARTDLKQSSLKNSISDRPCTNTKNRKSSLTNILSILKQSSTKAKDKKKNCSIKSDQLHITPRDIDLRSPTQRTQIPSQQKITSLLKSGKPKCFTPRTNQPSNQSPQNIVPKKVQLLELKVMSDLQSLLQKKLVRDSKQYVTLHLDSVTMAQDPRSLTQRITSTQQNTTDLTNKLRTQLGRKKLNIRELNQFRNLAVRIQEPLSNREPRVPSSKKGVQTRQINTSGEQKLVYYQQVHSARQGGGQSISNPSQSTFAPTSQSSCQTSKELKGMHQKSVSARMQQQLKSKLNMDSQLYKAALSIAGKQQPRGKR